MNFERIWEIVHALRVVRHCACGGPSVAECRHCGARMCRPCRDYCAVCVACGPAIGPVERDVILAEAAGLVAV